jgi:microcystin-dependent protein
MAEKPKQQMEGDKAMDTGIVVAFAGTKVPKGWELCDGRMLDRTKQEYAALFEAIGAIHGGDANPNFKLPDYRGLFLRGVDHAAGRDPDTNEREAPGTLPNAGNFGNAVGSIQQDQFGSHSHPLPREVWSFSGTGSNQPPTAPNGGAGVTVTNAIGGKETRPKNAYVNYIIKL